jgi:hypothetical protein
MLIKYSMTKYEKIYLFVSFLSLLCSILLPVISHYKLNNEFPPVGERPQIEIEKGTAQSGDIGDGEFYNYDIIIRNTGKRPARWIDINVKNIKEYHGPRAPLGFGSIKIDTEPFTGNDIKYNNRGAYMRITQPVGSKEKLKIYLRADKVPITSICFVTEYGDRTCQEYEEKI